MNELTETGSFPRIIPSLDADSTLPTAEVPELLVITGMSGAGRTRAAATLQDLDWYVVDNLPAGLLSALAGLISSDGGVTRLAVVVNVRSHDFSELVSTLDHLRDSGSLTYRVMFRD